MHVGLPAVQREGLASTHDRGQLGFGHLREIDVAFCGFGPGHLQIVGARHGVHVGDIAIISPAHLDADWIDQHQP